MLCLVQVWTSSDTPDFQADIFPITFTKISCFAEDVRKLNLN